MARLLVVLCASVFQLVFGQVDNTCKAVSNEAGTCISIYMCEPYIKMLESYGHLSEIRAFLKDAACGFEGTAPKVCCPQQFVPPSTAKNSVTPASTTVSPNNNTGKSLPATDSSDFIRAFPSPPECGFSKAEFGKVVGGEDAKLGDLPWMALLGYEVRASLTNWKCGGSLVSQRHVLTAAHCIHNQESALYVVRLGELDLASEDDGATPIDVLIKKKIKHEQYNPKSFENDIGLLILQDDVQYTELIKPICLPADSKLRTTDFVGWMPFIAGWGKTRAREAAATHLQVLQLPVLSNNVCVQRYSQYENQVIDGRVLCAGFLEGGRDSCSGDSGGPLMQPIPVNLTSFFYQTGVVSFGAQECARPGLPGIYTRVTSFIPWLEKNMLGAP